MPILRVFPRKTKATPEDEYVAIGTPDLFIPDDISEIHISVAFTWDLIEAERLTYAWSRYGNVKIGGPATGMRGEAFTPGMYLKHGYTITSRGCHNHCWFCSVPKREGTLRELPINDGWILLDNNILACSEKHIRAVFDMLKLQQHRPQFTGGIEATKLNSSSLGTSNCSGKSNLNRFSSLMTLLTICLLLNMPLNFSSKLGTATGAFFVVMSLSVIPALLSTSLLRRLETVKTLGFCPMAMLYRDFKGETTHDWRRFQRSWARPAAIYSPNWHDPLIT